MDNNHYIHLVGGHGKEFRSRTVSVPLMDFPAGPITVPPPGIVAPPTPQQQQQFEDAKEKKPGELSDELRTALGMPIGPASHKTPPPWLIAQQIHGPPPSYPNLKIPGLVLGTNSTDPDVSVYSFHRPFLMNFEQTGVDLNMWRMPDARYKDCSDEEFEQDEDLGEAVDENITPVFYPILPPQNFAANQTSSAPVVEEMVNLALDPSDIDMDNEAMAQQKLKRKNQDGGGDSTSMKIKKYN